VSQTLEQQLSALKERLIEVNDLRSAGAVLSWDQSTHMPRGGAEARARQRATLSRIAHQKATDAELGHLLDWIGARSADLSEIDAALVRVARRDFEKANKVPADFVARASACHAQSYAAWSRARADDDFGAVADHLRANIDITHAYATYFAPFENIADPLIDAADEGMTVRQVQALFREIRPALVASVKVITELPPLDASCLKKAVSESDQLAFGLDVADRVGYDLERGRLDKTLHPFCTRFSAGDVRITTRFREDDVTDAFFSTVHETGHALYEQGVARELDGTPLGRGTSSGVHESQARLWENIVGRSRGFWSYWYPELQKRFPAAFGDTSLDAFYGVINRVERSLIRTDADEVTYNLHIMMRFDLEIDMLEGRLDVADLPEAWRAKMVEDIGVEPTDDRDGCLQDVHWYSGYMAGRFQSYTIGNVLAAQLYNAALRERPGIPSEIAHGDFDGLREWLRREVHMHGRALPPNAVIEKATGEALHAAPYLAYLRGKFSELYGLDLAE
jgi:carboxypeptidase Taq